MFNSIPSRYLLATILKEAADAERRHAIEALRAKRDELYRDSDVASDRRFIGPKKDWYVKSI